MAHIDVPKELPGILGLLAFRPELAKPMSAFTQALLRGPSTLSPGERELIAAYVSGLNACRFCERSHTAAAEQLWGNGSGVVAKAKVDVATSGLSEKMKALLAIARGVQGDPKEVRPDLVQKARSHGATDVEIHDTVLIAAAFCMFNRYVDGLAAWTPDAPEIYEGIGRRLAEQGYLGF